MTTKTDIHPIQGAILCKLLFVKEAGFAELNDKKLGSDIFSFHLRELTNWNLIEKNKEGKYLLTTKGKEYANRFDTEQKEIERQPKIGVLVVCMKKINKKKEYLIQQRLKQPYFGFWGFMTGKVRWGETMEETAQRELVEETGLRGKMELVRVRHKMDYSQTGELLEDKFFMVNRVINPKGLLIEEFEGGKNCWMTKDEILKLPDLFDGVEESMAAVENKNLDFKENKYKVKGY